MQVSKLLMWNMYINIKFTTYNVKVYVQIYRCMSIIDTFTLTQIKRKTACKNCLQEKLTENKTLHIQNKPKISK